MSLLKGRAVSAVLWSAVERLSGQLIRFGIGVVLARMLLPAEFGLIGMITLFMGMAQVFVNCGFGEALIQKQNATRLDESSVFYFNLVLGVAAAGLLYAAAPWIAEFYQQPDLIWLTRLMAVNIVVGSLRVVQTMLLTKKLDFKKQIKIGLTSTLISGAIAIGMAWHGYGVLSLVAQVLIGNVINTIMLWVFQDWRPLLSFSWLSLKGMYPYGSRLFASALLNSVFNEIYTVVIGRLYDPATLGFFTRARQMQRLPLDNLGGIVSRVSFPIFASVQNDKGALKRGVRKACTGLAWLIFPVMVALGISAKPIVVVLLTEKWLPCVPYIQLLCLSGILYPLSLVHVNVLSAQGRSDLFLRLEIIKKALVVLSVALSYRHGVVGLLIGGIIVSVISYYLNSRYSSRLIDYSFREQIWDVLPYFALSAFMGICIHQAGRLPFTSSLSLLFVQITTGVLVYLLGSWLFRLTAFTEIREMIYSKLPRSKIQPYPATPGS